MWYVYIIECVDSSLYTGVTNDIANRINSHNNGTGAKYTKGRGPVKIVYTESFENRSEAQKREYEIKQLNKAEKKKLITVIY